jgi:putative SOS response-associated peptidase YedK
MHDRTGNLPPLPGIFPDYPAPIVRNSEDGRELTMARWGMPTPPQYLVDAKGSPKKSDSGVTNIRNTRSSHWRRWLPHCAVHQLFGKRRACRTGRGRHSGLRWRGPAAGIFRGYLDALEVRSEGKEGETENDIFAFLTTEPNALVSRNSIQSGGLILELVSNLE